MRNLLIQMASYAKRRRGALLFALPLLATVASLTGSSAQPGQGGQVANLPDGPGKDSFVQVCSSCHALGTVTGTRHTPEEWNSVIQSMIGMGAQIDDAQAASIHDYLAANFAPTGNATQASVAAAPSGPAPVLYPRPSGPNQWPAYGGGNASDNFSPLTQITPANVSRLQQAWVYHYGAGQTPVGDQGLDYRFEVTPLIIGGVMYLSTPASPAKPGLKASITALRPETGEVLWKYESPLNIHGRGIAYWPGDANTAPRIIFATDKGMIGAVDVTTGKPAKGFGRGGQIDAYIGVASEKVGESRRDTYTVPNPVLVYKDMFITASRPGEVGPPGPRGDIRAWDAHTGRLLWDFHVIAQPGEPGFKGWSGNEWRDLTGANTWTTFTMDNATGTLFATTGDANAPIETKGPELYSSSMLAINANTGKLKWYHQIVHHDQWDWDSPTPTVMADVKWKGKTVPAIMMTGKHSLFFMFDRRTGASINGFKEKPTPQPPNPPATLPKTQPFPDAPGPLARVQMTRDEIPDLFPGMKAACQKIWDDNHTVSEPLYYVRPSGPVDYATITYNGGIGGPNWGGPSFNPDTRLFVVNVQNRAAFSAPTPNAAPGAGGNGGGHPAIDDDAPPPAPRVRAPAPAGAPGAAPAAAAGRGGRGGRGGGVSFTFTTPDGFAASCAAPPYGELVAVNVDTHQIAWRSPLGLADGYGDKGIDLGTQNLGGNISTKGGVIFIGATNDRRFRAFDAKTGKKLWETELEASGAATPITYMGADGKQYVVMAAGGGTSIGQKLQSDAVVAYRLP